MDFGFSEEQDLLRQEVRRFLDERCPLEEVRRIQETPACYDEKLWKELAQLGWLGLTIPEEYGGAGLGWIDLTVLLEEAGRSLFPAPLIPTLLAAHAISQFGDAAQRKRWLPAIAEGSLIGTLALSEQSDSIDPRETALVAEPDGNGFVLRGEKRFVSDPETAGIFIVSFRHGEGSDDLGLAVVEAGSEGVSGQSFPDHRCHQAPGSPEPRCCQGGARSAAWEGALGRATQSARSSMSAPWRSRPKFRAQSKKRFA